MKFVQRYIGPNGESVADARCVNGVRGPITVPLIKSSSMSDFRSFDEMINDGDEDSLKFEAYDCFGNEVPFQNKHRDFVYKD